MKKIISLKVNVVYSDKMKMDENQDQAVNIAAIGKVLRTARKEKGLSIEMLAKTAGVGAGTVSMYERGMGNPTVQTLRRLADILGLPLTGLATSPSAVDALVPHPSSADENRTVSLMPRFQAGRVSIVRQSERRRLVLPGVGPVYDILSPDLDGALLLMHSIFRVGFDNLDEPFQHFGEEVVTVLEGRLEGRIGDTTFVLEEGDTVTFDAALPHGWRTLGDTNASLYSALTPPVLK